MMGLRPAAALRPEHGRGGGVHDAGPGGKRGKPTMERRRLWGPITVLGLTIALATGCAQAPKPSSGTRIAISVTENGFEPKVVTVPAGKPVTLVVTRHTDETCVRDFVMADRNIKKPLPLDRPIEITFTPEKPGDLTYACTMDMFRGTVRVE